MTSNAPARAGRPSVPPVRETERFTFIKSVWVELKKVTWPTREDVYRLTILVSGVSIAIGILLGALDMGFTELIRVTLSLGR